MTSTSSAGSSAGALQVEPHLNHMRCNYEMHCPHNPIVGFMMDCIICVTNIRMTGLKVDLKVSLVIGLMIALMVASQISF